MPTASTSWNAAGSWSMAAMTNCWRTEASITRSGGNRSERAGSASPCRYRRTLVAQYQAKLRHPLVEFFAKYAVPLNGVASDLLVGGGGQAVEIGDVSLQLRLAVPNR